MLDGVWTPKRPKSASSMVPIIRSSFVRLGGWRGFVGRNGAKESSVIDNLFRPNRAISVSFCMYNIAWYWLLHSQFTTVPSSG
jgi:hypothetical protein